jgi:hypothetical protein
MNETSENSTEPGGGSVDPERCVAESRRDFLKKAGKFAVYTPPAVMVLMKPSYATVSGSGTGRPYPIPTRPER